MPLNHKAQIALKAVVVVLAISAFGLLVDYSQITTQEEIATVVFLLLVMFYQYCYAWGRDMPVPPHPSFVLKAGKHDLLRLLFFIAFSFAELGSFYKVVFK